MSLQGCTLGAPYQQLVALFPADETTVLDDWGFWSSYIEDQNCI